MENEILPVSPGEKFCFACTPDVPCFNECCRDLNQFLTPYDIICLKNYLNMPSGAFLDKYTTQYTGPETGLPVISLKMNPDDGLKCPFVTDKGCGVYDARPSSCRTYPLARLASRSRETGRISEQYALIKEPHCLGGQTEKQQTTAEWVKEQGIAVYNEMNDMFMEIIALKNRLHPAPLDIKERHIFRLGCYDMDNFRQQITENRLLNDMNIDSKVIEAAKTDDTALFKLGFQWVKYAVFGENPPAPQNT